MAALVGVRRDLRIRDNPALRAALDEPDRVVPVFRDRADYPRPIFDHREARQRGDGPYRSAAGV